MRKDRIRRAVLRSGLPEDAVSSGVRVTMMGRAAVLVQGRCSIVEFGSERIRLKTSQGTLSVHGAGLLIRELSVDLARIEGDELLSVSYAHVDGRA